MINHKTVLVLGAGASVAVGYPVGAGLRQKLLQIYDPGNRTAVIVAGLMNDPEQLSSFVQAFKFSQMMSIDAFLARRPEFMDIGKRAIATVLLQCEGPDAPFNEQHEDSWYKYLFNAIAAESWEALDFSNLQIISFNYDRSLEHYLFIALQNAYGKPPEEVLAKLASLSILHIYGTLGATLPNLGGYFVYGKGADRETVFAAAQMLRVIPEGRSDDVVLRMARDQLTNASRIAFLGFGFDPTNLQRLDSENTCRARIARRDNTILRLVAATCRGLTIAERARAIDLTAGHEGAQSNIPHKRGVMEIDTYMDADCLTLLRSTQVI